EQSLPHLRRAGQSFDRIVIIEQDIVRQLAHVIETPLSTSLFPCSNLSFPARVDNTADENEKYERICSERCLVPPRKLRRAITHRVFPRKNGPFLQMSPD